MISAPFRFDADDHTYTRLADNRQVPHITGLLTVSGWTNEQWFDDESSQRGRAVHQLTAEYDLRAISAKDAEELDSPYKPYLLAHVACDAIVKPQWRDIETPCVHPALGFAGRIDRGGRVWGAKAVWEVKSGAPQRGHQIQTALQAILVSLTYKLPADLIRRYAEYIDERGRHRLEEHRSQADFREARRILKKYASGGCK